MKALIIVDVQNDFLPGGALAVAQGDEIIDIINKEQFKYELIVATQDWHPATHKSFASQYLEKLVGDIVDLNGTEQFLWPDHCVQGTEGAKFSDALQQDRIEAIFRKGVHVNIDSYSGFYDNNQQKNTGLDGFLKDRGVTEVHICGLAADYCVYFTAMDALNLGYKTAIMSKGTKCIDKESYMQKKEKFMQLGGFFI